MNSNDLWKNQNNCDDNMDYILKILNKFEIYSYNFVSNAYGELDLLIEHNLRKYRIELDFDKCQANIKRGKMTYCSQKHSREFMPVRKTIKNYSVWYDVIKWIKKDNGNL